MRTLKSPYISGSSTFLYLRKRNFVILQEMELSYTSGNGTFLYFGKGIFRTGGIFRNRGIFRTLASLENWHFQNHGIFRTQSIFRILSNTYDRTFCKNIYLVHSLIFREMKFSSQSELKKVKRTCSYMSGNGISGSKLKKLLFFYENALGFFITISTDVFISLLIFTIVDCICWFHQL